MEVGKPHEETDKPTRRWVELLESRRWVLYHPYIASEIHLSSMNNLQYISIGSLSLPERHNTIYILAKLRSGLHEFHYTIEQKVKKNNDYFLLSNQYK
jgi:hypothetical protein